MPSADENRRPGHRPEGGEAWFELRTEGGVGRVLASFRRATYIDVGGMVLAVTGRDVPPGPIHLRVDEPPAVPAGAPVTVSGHVVAVDGLRLRLRDLSWWRPAVLDPRALVAAAAAGVEHLDGADRSELARDRTTYAARAALADGDLEAVVASLGGRGVGLTPTGDDVLAGIMVVLASAGFDRGVLESAAGRARTHPIAHAFLRWAARGQMVEPVHQLLGALVAADRTALRRHQERVVALGHTSGADLLLGLRLALSVLPSPDLGATAPQNGRSASQMAFIGASPGLCQR